MKRNYKTGQSLMEVVVAMALVIAAAIALVATSIFTQKTSRSANAQTQATKLVEENIEQIRVLRDRKGYGAIDFNLSCMVLLPIPSGSNIDSWRLSPCSSSTTPPTTNGEVIAPSSNNLTSFIRRVSVLNSGPDKKEVKVSVFWEESGGTKSVSSVTFFSRCFGGSC